MQKLVRWIALLAATLIALYLCWLMLQPFIEVLLWALVLVIVFFPIHRRIEARMAGRPSLGAILSCLLVIATILIPLTLVTLAVVREISNAAQNLQASIGSLLDPNSPLTGRFLQWLGQYVDVEQFRTQSQQFVIERLKTMGGNLANRTLGFVGGLVGAVVEVFFVIFTMYYLFRDGDRMRVALADVLPLDERDSREILNRTRDVIGASVYGVLVIAMIQGLLGGVAFWALGLPSPLLWGVVMLFLSMIPMAGSFVVWVPAAIFLAVSGHWVKALLLVVWGALVIGSVDNFLRPKLIGEKTRLHELLIFFSVLGGLQVFGVLGIVLGPVVVAITLALLEVFRRAERSTQAAGGEPTLVEEQAEIRNVDEDEEREGG
ncbi:MAG TPA: AI-2E family transporter [Pyrinomonadaceae bacterium]|jgi:predicted PurR-regulated permease PerM